MKKNDKYVYITVSGIDNCIYTMGELEKGKIENVKRGEWRIS